MATPDFKRFRMVIDLQRFDLPVPEVPEGYRWVAWKQLLCERHAVVKWKSFRNDVDGRVFPCLSEMSGCRKLMGEIARQPHFAPDSTWLLSYHPDSNWPAEDAGAIQGMIRSDGIGSIQNVGTVQEHRGLGLGKALMLKALNGFYLAGCHKVVLEVTAINKVAVGLYVSLGFQVIEVLYRSGDGGTVVKGTERQPQKSS
ncbi:MAG: N-acetyltransferase [Fuerstiella sp.]